MVLVKRRVSWAARFLKGSAGTVVVLAAATRYADYKSAEVDREFLWRRVNAEAEAAAQREQLRAAADAADVRDRTRARMKQITSERDGRPAHLGQGEEDYGRPWTLPKDAAVAQELDSMHPHLGDICLFMGTGSMSWKITRLGFIFSGFNTDALRYSHVGLCVAPLPPGCLKAMAELKEKSQGDASASKSRWGKRAALAPSPTPLLDALHAASADGTPLVIEAIDNKDCNARNVLPAPEELLHDQVMVSRLEDRTFGVDYREEKPRWCYNRLALRRVHGVRWTPERVEEFERWLADSMRRPMDKKPTLPLAMADPRLHTRADPRIISCSELVADGIRALGLLEKVPTERWREFGKGRLLPSVMYAPMHFTTLGERWCDWDYLSLKDPETMRYGREQRVLMSRTQTPPPADPPADRYWPKALAVAE